MTLSEVRDAFIADYTFEAQRLGLKRIDVPNKMIASWISRGQQDIADRLSIMVTNQDISLTAVTVYTEHNLNSKFAGIVKAEINGYDLDIVGVKDIPTTGTLVTGQPSKIAAFHDASQNAYKAIVYPLPDTSYTLKVWYHINLNFYSPSGSADQDWGNFSGTAWTGDLKIPDRYLDLLLEYMMAKAFPERIAIYERRIRGFKARNASTPKELTYKLGING